MADIKLSCVNCGSLFHISEYIDGTTASCPECGHTMDVDKATVEEDSGLSVRKDMSGSGFGGSQGDGHKPVVATLPPLSKKDEKRMAKLRKEDDKKASSKKDVNPYEKTAPRQWHGVVTFLILSILFFLLQSGKAGSTDLYYSIRLFLFPLIYIAVIVTAFGEGYLAGILCLLLPPYLFYYAVSRTDVYYIRGAFIAVMIGLGMELYYEPERSVLANVESSINAVIDGGAGAINRAGSSGVEFVD